MSPQEQMTEAGKMLENFAAAKKELAALHSRASEMGKQLSTVSQLLQQHAFSSKTLDLTTLPNIDEIKELVTDARRAKQTMKEVSDLLANMGIKIE